MLPDSPALQVSVVIPVYNEEANIVDLVSRAGYHYAYTACEHHLATHPALTIERLLLWEGSSIGADGSFSSAIFNCQTHGLWPPARHCERTHAA